MLLTFRWSLDSISSLPLAYDIGSGKWFSSIVFSWVNLTAFKRNPKQNIGNEARHAVPTSSLGSVKLLQVLERTQLLEMWWEKSLKPCWKWNTFLSNIHCPGSWQSLVNLYRFNYNRASLNVLSTFKLPGWKSWQSQLWISIGSIIIGHHSMCSVLLLHGMEWTFSYSRVMMILSIECRISRDRREIGKSMMIAHGLIAPDSMFHSLSSLVRWASSS